MASNLKDIYVGVKQNDPNRIKNDFYPTPPLATHILCKYADVPKTVIEPCAGRGNISIELLRHGHTVHSYDLNEYDHLLCPVKTGFDVLKLEKQNEVNALITNPPYHKDLPRKIAEKAISEYDFVALFIRLTFLEGKKRNKLFTKHVPSDIIFLSDRIRFDRPEYTGLIEPIKMEHQIGGMIAYCWVIWNKNAQHENTKLSWVILEDEYDEWYKNYNESKI